LEPNHEVALERLALVYLAQNRLLDAVGVFDETRRRLPRLTVRSTVNMGALLLQLDRPGLALAELESIASDLANEEDPRLLAGYWYMGEACLALERIEDAREAYQRYLRETESAAGAMVEDLRARAADRLVEIGMR
jgi:tetratricopeptide (TPR) repeat protein